MTVSLKRGRAREPFEGVQRQRSLPTMELGCILQRLFSFFPNGWPGFGLLLIRLGLSIRLVYLGFTSLARPFEPIPFAQMLVSIAGGLLLFGGLWTPLAGALVAINEIWMAVAVYPSQQEGAWFHVLRAIMALGVAMLGPGAWSIDARLFGRKKFDIDRSRSKRKSL